MKKRNAAADLLYVHSIGAKIMCRALSFWCLVATLALFSACASTPPGPRIAEGLPHFIQVDAHVFRGAQPKPEGYAALYSTGIRTLVDLRERWEQPPSRKEEEKAARAAHIDYIPVPMAGLGAPNEKDVKQILAIMNDPEKQPVFIHCQRGADRTGTILAIYRITHDCWTADRAIQEARDKGMYWYELGMRRFIRRWYEKSKAQSCTPAS